MKISLFKNRNMEINIKKFKSNFKKINNNSLDFYLRDYEIDDVNDITNILTNSNNIDEILETIDSFEENGIKELKPYYEFIKILNLYFLSESNDIFVNNNPNFINMLKSIYTTIDKLILENPITVKFILLRENNFLKKVFDDIF